MNKQLIEEHYAQQPHSYCIILAGGLGTRFWPISKPSKPKQFLDLLGVGQTMIQMTYKRYLKIIPKERIFVITGTNFKQFLLDQLPDLPEENIMFEPVNRSTAPCIAWASYRIKKMDPDATVVVCPADHLIMEEDEFLERISQGLAVASKRKDILTIGINPNRPDTSYGYIQVDDEVGGTTSNRLYHVKTFTEKPEYEQAKLFVESGEFYWNSGHFIWHIDVILKAIRDRLPDLADKMEQGVPYFDTPDEQSWIDTNFPTCDSVSIDYGILEYADNVTVSIGDFGWTDLGSWSSLHQHAIHDENDNVLLDSTTELYDTKGCLVKIPKNKLAIIEGLENYLVVEEDNLLLICPSNDDVKIRDYITSALLKYPRKKLM